MNTERVNTTVDKLQPGDFLIGSEKTIVSVQKHFAGDRDVDKRGKCRVVYTKHGGVLLATYWNARTTMMVERQAAS